MDFLFRLGKLSNMHLLSVPHEPEATSIAYCVHMNRSIKRELVRNFLSSLTANISSLIARLTSLKLIDLSFNLYEGFSFGSLTNHSRFEFVWCICNDKDVKIETESSDWVPLFQLDFLVICNCNLNKLSNKVSTFLLHQYNFIVLDLSNNMLKGRLPSWLFENNMKLEYVTLNDNSFSGHVHLLLCLKLIGWICQTISSLESFKKILGRSYQSYFI